MCFSFQLKSSSSQHCSQGSTFEWEQIRYIGTHGLFRILEAWWLVMKLEYLKQQRTRFGKADVG